MIRWITLFFNNRIAIVRLDRKTNHQKPMKIGVLQESFIVPIFFILFIALLFKIPTKKEKKAKMKICSYINNNLLIL